MIACARFCGICPATAQRKTTTTPATTPTTTTTTTTKPTTTKAPTTQTNNACDTAPCLNSGTCRSLAGGAFECTCPSSFGGPFCERDLRTTTVAPTTTPVPVTTKSPTSTTPSGGICGNNPCLNGGTCKPTADGFSCTCTAGFTGRFCLNIVSTSRPAGTCNFNPCLNGGTCLNNTGAISCVCPSGFTGGSCADRDTTATTTPSPKGCA